MELKLKIYITDADGKKFMGIGVLWLLEQIRRCGSIRRAAEEMGISYSKAYQMLSTLEEALDIAVLERKKGGASRDGAGLTPLGLRLIDRYNYFQEEVKAQAQLSFNDFISGIREDINE